MNYHESQGRTVPAQWNEQEQVTTLHASSFHDVNDEGALRNQVQLEQPSNLIGNHRKDGLKGSNNSFRGVEGSLAAKINTKNMPSNYQTHIISRHVTTAQQSNGVQAIEIEVLESFSEFAAFLELQNPICPAEHLDTPEKLMNLLSWDVWVQ